MSGNNGNDNKENFLKDEYVALMRWRVSKLTRQDTWGSILLPAAFAVYGAGIYRFLMTEPLAARSYVFLPLSWVAALVLLLLWRWNDYLTDDTIKKYAYPRLLELEDRLGFRAVKEWVQYSMSIDIGLVDSEGSSRAKYQAHLGGADFYNREPSFKKVIENVFPRLFRLWTAMCCSKTGDEQSKQQRPMRVEPGDRRSLFKWDVTTGRLIFGSLLFAIALMTLEVTVDRFDQNKERSKWDQVLGRIQELEKDRTINAKTIDRLEENIRVNMEKTNSLLGRLDILTSRMEKEQRPPRKKP